MLTIIGQILRIIGIGLASIAGILLLFLLLALFVPFRYRGVLFKKPEGQQADIRVGWLFRFLSARIYWTKEKPKITLRIAGIPLFDSTKPKKQKKVKQIAKKTEPEQLPEPISSQNQDQDEPSKAEERFVREKETEQREEALQKTQAETKDSYDTEPKPKEEKDFYDTEPKPRKDCETTCETPKGFKKLLQGICSLITWIKNQIQFILSLIQSVIDFFVNMKERLKAVGEKIRNLRTKTGLIRTFFTDDTNRTGIAAVLRMITMVGKHIFPLQISGTVIFGTGDAYSTTQALVYAGMFYGFYGGNFNLEADFEKKRFEVEVNLKGRIRLFQLLIYVFRVWRTAEFRKLLKNIKKLKGELS